MPNARKIEVFVEPCPSCSEAYYIVSVFDERTTTFVPIYSRSDGRHTLAEMGQYDIWVHQPELFRRIASEVDRIRLPQDRTSQKLEILKFEHDANINPRICDDFEILSQQIHTALKLKGPVN
jgi:3-methyladenine DNA glycosylase AlkC